jgi:hypothetical protein
MSEKPRGKKRAATSADPSQSLTVAQTLQAKRTKGCTKQNYKSKIGIMTAWMQCHAPDCVNDDELIVPVKKEPVLQFFGYLCGDASSLDQSNQTQNDKPMSISNVKGYRSALVDLYKQKFIKLDPTLDVELKSVLDGYDKLINDLKKRGLMKTMEGKRHLKSDGYTMLARKFMTKIPDQNGNGQSWSMVLFAWSFFVLMWNLMSRADSVDTIMLQHIDWSEDALTIEEQGHKGDQTGADKFAKHIYANPFEPEKCPILALAVLIFCCPNRTAHGRQQLFYGTNSKDRFNHLLRQLLNSLTEDELQMLGCPPNDIGGHSLRKGSCTFCLGQVNGPTPVTVYLRMGQSLGQLKDRYVHAAEGADQLCGRMVAGLPFNSEEFGVLPPHFTHEMLHQMNSEFWRSTVPGYENYPKGMQSVLPFLMASLIYHERFLRDNLSPLHPVFLSRTFTQNVFLDTMRTNVRLGIGKCEYTQLKSTGIPPHLAIAAQISSMRKETDDLRTEMQRMKDQLVAQMPQTIASMVSNEIRENFSIDGVAPITIRDIDSRMESLREHLTDQIGRITGHQSHNQLSATNTQIETQWKTWNWGDGLICHFVPRNWNFPDHITTKHMWDLWFFGDHCTGIRPFRLLNKRVELRPQDYMKHTRAKQVMEHCVSLAKELELIEPTTYIGDLVLARSDSVFETVYNELLKRLYGDNGRRTEEICYGRIYNLLCKYKKRLKASMIGPNTE